MKRLIRWLALAGLPVLAFAQTAPPAGTAMRAPDDKLVVFGSDNDFQVKYNSSGNRLEFVDAAGNQMLALFDGGSSGILSSVQYDIRGPGSYATQMTSLATAYRAVVWPDAAGTVSLLGSGIESSEITDGTIVNADINASAAIAASKLAAGSSGQVLITSGSTPTWSTVASAGITDGTIVNADVNASAAIAVSKLAAGTEGYILKTVSGVPAWAAASSGSIGGTGPTTDNALPRMDGTGGTTLQGYSSNTPTIDDDGLMALPGGLTVTGQSTIGYGSDNTRPLRLVGSTSPAIQLYRGSASGANLRWVFGNSGGSESGTLTGNQFYVQAYDITGGYSHDALMIDANPAVGARFSGTAGTKRDLYVDGIYYAANDLAITNAAGKLVLGALDTTGASVGYVPSYNGSTVTWVAGSGNVSNAGSGTDNHFPRFNLTGTAIQDGQTVEDDSGNVDVAGTITSGSSNTQLTDSAGLVRDAALSSTVGNLDQAETITGNWVNTANPWADNEVADALTVSGGSINNSVIGGSTPAAGTFTTLASTGDATVGDGSAAKGLNINGATGTARDVRFQTAGSNRWVMRAEGTAESGSNAGSAWQLLARDDSGNAIDNAITMFRAASGAMTLGAGRSISLSGQFINTVATGTAPLSITSTTKVSNLNVDQVDGQDFASPGAIGGTSRGSALFTTIGANNVITASGGSTGASPTAQIAMGSYYDNADAPSVSHISLYGGTVGLGVSASNTDQIVGSGKGFRVWGDPTATNPYASIQSTFADFDGYIKNGSSDIQLTNATGTIKQSAIEQNSATSGQVLAWNGSAWAPAAAGGALESATQWHIWEEFLGENWALSGAGNVKVGKWIIYNGTNSVTSINDATNGSIALTSGTTALASASARLGNWETTINRPFQRAKNAYCEVALTSQTMNTDGWTCVGFVYDETPYQGYNSSKKCVLFIANAATNSGNWMCITADGSTRDTYNTSVAATGARTLRIETTSSGVTFKIDGSSQAGTFTHLPGSTDKLSFAIYSYNVGGGIGTGATMNVDYADVGNGTR